MRHQAAHALFKGLFEPDVRFETATVHHDGTHTSSARAPQGAPAGQATKEDAQHAAGEAPPDAPNGDATHNGRDAPSAPGSYVQVQVVKVRLRH